MSLFAVGKMYAMGLPPI